MAAIIIGLFIVTVLMALLWWGDEYAEARIGLGLLLVILGIILGKLMADYSTPTIEDYIHGKVKVEVRQIYENEEVIRCDTNYYKL